MRDISKIDFRRKPYKGIKTKVAAALGESMEFITYRVRIGDEQVMRLIETEVERVEVQQAKRFAKAERTMGAH